LSSRGLHFNLASDECLKRLITLGLMVLHGRAPITGAGIADAAGLEFPDVVSLLVAVVIVAGLGRAVEAEVDLPGPFSKTGRVESSGDEI
jgi:hypothetical protein